LYEPKVETFIYVVKATILASSQKSSSLKCILKDLFAKVYYLFKF